MAPSTSDCATVQPLVVLERSKAVWVPLLRAVPVSVQVCGDEGSLVPPVWVMVMLPLERASLKV